MEYINEQAQLFPPSNFPHFKCSNYSFIYSNAMFLHISHSHFQTVFSFLFSIKKHDSFHAVNEKWLHFVQALKIKIYSNAFVRKQTIWEQNNSMETPLRVTSLFLWLWLTKLDSNVICAKFWKSHNAFNISETKPWLTLHICQLKLYFDIFSLFTKLSFQILLAGRNLRKH